MAMMPFSVGLSCAYRGENNTRCAVGCLISNKDYRPEMEGETVTGLMGENLLPKHLVPFSKLLDRMQSVHDWSDGMIEWERCFKIVARDFNLKVPSIS